MRQRPSRAPALLGLVAGLLVTAGLPPFGWWPLALVGAGLLALVIEPLPRRPRALVGLTFGIGFLAPGLWWMTEFSLPGWVLAMLLEAAMITLAVVLVPRGRWQVVALPATLVLVDALRGVWPFGGVPIATVGETQIGGPLLEAARIGGGLLVAALVGVAGVALAAAGQRRWWRAAGGAALVTLVAAAGVVAPDGARIGTIRATVVQGGGERGTRAINSDERAVFDRHVEASRLVPDDAELILWPEDVVDVEGDVLATPEGDRLGALAAEREATLVAGVVSGYDDDFVNVAQVWLPTGAPGRSYEKNHRVPFGEYIPFRSVVEEIADVSAVPRDARVGHGPGILPTPAGRLGVVISFEVFFARRARDALRSGAEILLVPTNASSYSSTQMPALELGAARIRAVETGRDVLQAAPTGFSAVVDHRGEVTHRTDLGRQQVLTATVDRRTGQTLYTRFGDGPLVVGAALALLVAWGASSPPGSRRRSLSRWRWSSRPATPRS